MYQQEQVERGIALLDEKKPTWREKFVPAALEMSWYTTCILGQVYGEYMDGLWYLGIVTSKPQRMALIRPYCPATRRRGNFLCLNTGASVRPGKPWSRTHD